MKRIIILTVILLIIITFSGCKKSNVESVNEGVPTNNDNSLSQEVKNETPGGELSAIEKIKEALTSSKSLECTYGSSENELNVEVKTFMQGDKYKTEFMAENKKNYSIFDGKVSYSWEEGSNQGIKIDIACLESLNTETTEPMEGENETPVEVKEETEEIFEGAQDVKCQETGKIDFSIPENVNFIDQCEMLKSQQKLINDLNGQIPAGLPKF